MEYSIREYNGDDLKWIVETHGELYHDEYGFDETFPLYVSNPLEIFHADRNPEKECMWIAEANGERVGSVAIAKVDDSTAQFRWYLLLKEARGIGLGRELAEKAVQFSRTAGYDSIILWTVSILDAARYLYSSLGFTIEEKIPHTIWGRDLIEEKWSMKL